MTQSAYKSNDAKNNAIASYDNSLTHWPVPYKTRVVNTSFGETHVIISGSSQSQPLVLLHGGGGNSTMWFYNIAELSKEFQVFAVDIIGEAGKSAGTRPSFKSDGYVRWLKEVFDALGISKAAICGASLGGMIAHQFAIQYPQLVSSLALLAPPSLFEMRLSFLFRAILANSLPTAFFAKSFLNYISASALNSSEWGIKAFVIQVQSYKPNWNPIPIISDQELSQLPAKTLVLIGQDEVLYNPTVVATRIHSAAPSITVEIIPGAKHTVSVDQPGLVNQRLIQFMC